MHAEILFRPLSMAFKPMNHRRSNLLSRLAFPLLLLAHTSLFAVNDDQLQAIRALGELNGVALHCKALSETRRIKQALVLNLPKRRQLGELFDYETNKSYMAFIERNASCPSAAELSQRVDEALKVLEAAFATQ